MALPRNKTALTTADASIDALPTPLPLLIADTATSSASAEEENELTLLGMPREIRNHIYGYCLMEDNPIRLEIRGYRKPGEEKEVVRIGVPAKKNRRRVYNRRTRQWDGVPFKNVSILLVNKQIHDEAEPVLYGKNILQFQRLTVLKDFLVVIEERALFLRHLRIQDGGYVKSAVKSTVKLLSKIRLSKLDFGHGDLCRGTTYHGLSKLLIQDVANDWKPLLLSLQKTYAEENLRANALNVIGFDLGQCSACHYGSLHGSGRRIPTGECRPWDNWACLCKCEEAHEKNERMQEKLREAIAEYLEPEKKKTE